MPNSFFENELKFFYLILEIFNKVFMNWNWMIWRNKIGDWTQKIVCEDWSLEKHSFEAAIWRMNFKT